MAVRPTDSGKPPTPDALKAWPPAPKAFSKAEQGAWVDLGKAVMVLGTASAADLILASRAARVMARVTELFDDDDLKPSTLASMLRIEVELLKQLGLSPQARRQVTPLSTGKREASGFEDVE